MAKAAQQKTEKASDIAKNIWLAGIGAYGKAFDEAQEAYGKAQEKAQEAYDKVTGKVSSGTDKILGDTTKLFDELVAKGKDLEAQAQSTLSDAKEVSTSTIEERINKVREGLTFKRTSNSDLNDKIDTLTKKIDKLLKTMPAAKKPAAKKPAAKKAPAKRKTTSRK